MVELLSPVRRELCQDFIELQAVVARGTIEGLAAELLADPAERLAGTPAGWPSQRLHWRRHLERFGPRR